MRRSTGLFLLSVGAMLFGVAIVAIIVVLTQGGRNGGVIAGAAAGVGLLGVLLIVAAIRLMRGQRPIGTPATPVEGRVGQYLADVVESRHFDGQNLEVHYKQPVKGKNPQPSSLMVRIKAAAPTTVQFNDETWFDKWCKRMGIARECQTGDEVFDDAVYVRTPSLTFAELYLKDESKRNAVINLRQLGFPEVRLTGTHIEAEWKHFDPKINDQADLTDQAVSELIALARDIPQEDPEGAGHRPETRLGTRSILWTFAIAYALTFIAVFVYPPIHESNLLLASLVTFIVVYPVFGWIAAKFLAGTSTSHDYWAKLMSVGILLFGFGSCGAVALVNAFEDDSPEDDRTSVIAEKRISSGRRGKTYYATVAAWDHPGSTLEFKVPAGDYNGIVPGKSKLELKTRKGRLGMRVVDLSADYRLRDPLSYARWYGEEHHDKMNLERAVYGLPEIYGEKIPDAQLIANPGCYPQTGILGLAPLVAEKLIDLNSIIIDSKSGVSGAGRIPKLNTHFPECNESVSAYNVGKHRHTPEIEQALSDVAGELVEVLFTPHLIPMDRGIFTTIYATPRQAISEAEAVKLYRNWYATAPFVRVRESLPGTKDTAHTNFVDISIKAVRGKLVILVCEDNLIRGASGVAVQNFNRMFGFEETVGLL